MKNYWLHFIGKSYYSVSKFIKEAEQLGISRAVSHNIFKKMNLGDTVILAQWTGKHSEIFGYFVINTITGISAEKLQELESIGAINKNEMIPHAITRGCGSYIITGSYSVADPQKIIDFIKNSEKDDFNRLMIGGNFGEISDLIPEKINIKTNIPFQQGFRLFDFERFKELAQSEKKIKDMLYYSEYYQNHFISDSNLLVIDNYKLN